MKPVLELSEVDGNAFAILGRARGAARRAGWSGERIDSLIRDATNGDYNHLLAVMMENFDVE